MDVQRRLATVSVRSGAGGNDGLTLGPTGIIYAANRNVSTITAYAANPSGTLNETPIVTVGGSNTGISSPTAAAIR